MITKEQIKNFIPGKTILVNRLDKEYIFQSMAGSAQDMIAIKVSTGQACILNTEAWSTYLIKEQTRNVISHIDIDDGGICLSVEGSTTCLSRDNRPGTERVSIDFSNNMELQV